MEKNLEIATQLLHKVEMTLETNDYKSVKLILQSYRNQLHNSRTMRTLKNVGSEEINIIMLHSRKLIDLIKKSQALLENLMNTDEYRSINALSLIIGDLQSARDSLAFAVE